MNFLVPLRSAAFLAFTLATFAPLPLHAQVAGYVTPLWVDVEFGSDTNPGTEGAPFQSITAAMAAANASASIGVTIIVNPGIYRGTNSGGLETWPINVKPHVSIQGTSALNTVLRGEGGENNTPLLQFLTNERFGFEDSYVDGLNIYNNGIGIRITNNSTGKRYAASPTISNCFITDHGQAGIQILSRAGGAPIDDMEANPPEYGSSVFVEHRPRIVNCSFRLNFVAISNRSNVEPYYGVNRPGILKIISAQSSKEDLNGVDDDDLLIQFDSENKSIFDRANDPDPDEPRPLPFPSIIWDPVRGAGVPIPRFVPAPFIQSSANPAPVPTLFVEDRVLALQGAPFAFGLGYDLRLAPNAVDDLDLEVDSTVGSTWTWSNLTTGKNAFSNGGEIWDWDCEGFGNPNDGSYIGADQPGNYLLAAYTPHTTQFFGGATGFFWVAQGSSASGTRGLTVRFVPVGSKRYRDNGMNAPGNRALRTQSPAPVPGLSGDNYLNLNYITLSPYSVSGAQPLTVVLPTLGTRLLVNEQLTTGSTFTNLQTYTIQ